MRAGSSVHHEVPRLARFLCERAVCVFTLVHDVVAQLVRERPRQLAQVPPRKVGLSLAATITPGVVEADGMTARPESYPAGSSSGIPG